MKEFLLQVFLEGWDLLVVAIFVNLAASWLKLKTWNSLFYEVREEGLQKAVKDIDILSLIFMFIIYPMILGYLIIN